MIRNASFTLEYVFLIESQTSFALDKNITTLFISGAIEFQNQVIIIESFSSHELKFGSPGFGPVRRMRLIFPFFF